MNNVKLDSEAKRTLREQGYSVKQDKNITTIKGKKERIQFIISKKGVLILCTENSEFCSRIESIRADEKQIKIKVSNKDGKIQNLNIVIE